ncbi:serine--tRNA ligase [Hellea balneolensis]|uniref:serine--tRNA ligase n=1 Tax=Hellea balneolensis TaxID=287478 RepID=UPI00041B0AFF|nr:serine--tRNA ligase [Hellea balneolensis]
MHDIKAIRENPESYDALWAKRGLEPLSKKILDQDKLIRKAMQVVQEAEAARNKSSKMIGQAMAKGDKDEAERLKTEVAGAKNVIAAMGAQVDSEKAQLQSLLESTPNIPFADVPEGEDENSNVELHTWGEPTKLGFEPKDHADLGEALGMMDFETAAKMSGSRFVVLSGKLSRLDRALAAFMLDLQTEEHGYLEHTPPLMVRPEALYGTGQLPKFMEDLYICASEGDRNRLSNQALESLDVPVKKFEQAPELNIRDLVNKAYAEAPTNEAYFLIPTAEVSLTNIVRESIVDPDTLPMRMTAHTPCFRSEAGSAGRDTKGMIRQHQFNKVELVSIVKPEDSEAEHKRMLGCAEEVLKRLELPYRVVELCTGDLGFGARRTFDIEVWLPSQDTYREISSCSNCGDFQARRMNARYKFAEKDNRFVHTLNGSGLAVGRTLVAVLENYQNEDGSITVPKALVPYMGGVEVISA